MINKIRRGGNFTNKVDKESKIHKHVLSGKKRNLRKHGGKG